jgi:hypothetical protein
VRAIVRGDGVDDPVGADLLRVVVEDRHSGLDARPDHAGFDLQVVPADRLERLRERRNDAGDDHPVDPGGERGRAVEIAEQHPVLVHRALRVGLDPPVPAEVSPVVDAEHGVRVAYVDRQQHRSSHVVAVDPSDVASV